MLKDAGTVRTLLYTCTAKDGCKGSVCVHVVPSEFEQIKDWLAELDLGIKYTGQGLPAISAQILLLLVKRGKTREYLSGEQKAELLETHGHLCALCGQKSSSFEFDHIVGLRQLVAGQEQVFQPVCPPCHELKTSQEGRSLCLDFMASHFERSVWGAYVMSSRPPPMVYQLKKPDATAALEIADVVRCRKRGLEYNQYPIPVFSPMDSIEEVHDGVLGDVNYITKTPRKASAHLELCYTSGWQHRCMTEFLLHHGIVTWTDVTHRIRATAQYPADTLATPLKTMELGWQAVGHGDLAKRSVNSLIGL